jgi:hypothetical protein
MPLAFLPSGSASMSYGAGVTANPLSLGFYQALDAYEGARVRRYVEFWNFYFGKHWSYQSEEGIPFVTVNYFRKIIDKLAEFMASKGFVITVPESLEETSKTYLDEVWKYNKRDQLSLEIALMGGVTGDVFVMVTDEEPSELQKRINPFSQGKTKIQLLPSTNVFPTWDPLNTDRLLQVRIETIYHADRQVRTPGIDTDDKGNYLSHKRFTQIITPDRIVEQYHGEIPSIRPNVLGEIPIVHIRNMSIPHDYYGMSDGQDLIDINREMNEKSTDISDIIHYHAGPITVITGAKTKALDRSPKAIWSGLPSDARVFNLSLEGDLGASQDYLAMMKRTLHELSDVPEGVLGAQQPISNTSGVALHIQYQPILGRVKKKRATYEPGFEKINYFILRIGMVKGRIHLPYDLCASCGGRVLEYDDPNGELVPQWSDELDTYVDVVKRIKRCFHVDKQTLEFMNPNDMRVKVWRQYGFGNEIIDVSLSEAKEIAQGAKSFWDYSYVEPEELEVYEATAKTVHAENQRRLDMAKGGEVELLPEPEMPRPRARPLPQGEAITYEEPENVLIVTPLIHPRTNRILRTIEQYRLLVPTGCRIPKYLNPYENAVTFNEVLPKDEALQASLYEQYQRMKIVDREWIQQRIPGIAEEMTNINRRMKANAVTVPERTVAEGFLNHTTSDLSPATTDLTNVSGSDGKGTPTPLNKSEE